MKKTGEWGEYFPMRLSPYCYNECMSQEYFPLTKEEVLKLDLKWFESDMQSHYQGQKIMIPENICDVDAAILNHILTCNNCKKNYKINTSELDFYKNMNIPVPVICSNCRYKGRMSHKNPRKLLPRNCSNCKIGIQSTYSDTRVEKVYCEECYLKTVY